MTFRTFVQEQDPFAGFSIQEVRSGINHVEAVRRGIGFFIILGLLLAVFSLV